MLGDIINTVQRPYPLEHGSAVKWKAVLANSIIVSLFLLVFRPFGLTSFPVPHILGYGLVTMVITAAALFVVPASIPFWFRESQWTVGRNIIFVSTTVFFIGLGNLLYTHSIARAPLTFGSFIEFQFFTLAVTFFIAASSTFIRYYILDERNKKEAKALDHEVAQHQVRERNPIRPEDEQFVLASDNGKEEVAVSLKNLLYIESADNYSEIVMEENRQIKKVLIRSSLKRVEDQLRHPYFFRCHRSYIVNLSKVISVKGNSQGYQLDLPDSPISVPVSRKYGTELSGKLRSLK